MYYISSKKDNLYGITDTKDLVEEFYSECDILDIVYNKGIKILGVSNKFISIIEFNYINKSIIKELDCKKNLSFEVVTEDLDKLELKLKLSGMHLKSFDRGFFAIDEGYNIKVYSSKPLMLGNKIGNGYLLFYNTSFRTIDFKNVYTFKLTYCDHMFNKCKANKLLNLNVFDTSHVTSMVSMFNLCKANSIDLSSFNTSNVTNMNKMFFNCEANSLDLSSFDTSNVVSMESMFGYCYLYSLDLSSFNTSNVVSMTSMFDNLRLDGDLDLSSFNTSKVTTMKAMFRCLYAKSLNLSSFNTYNVNDMSYMFHKFELNKLDVNNFDTSNVEDMSEMFYGCNFNSLDLRNFNTGKVKLFIGMFRDSNIKQLDIRGFIYSNSSEVSLMFDGSKSNILK